MAISAYRRGVPPDEWPVPQTAWSRTGAWVRGELMEPIRVLVAEDAPSVRRALAALFAAEPGVELVGSAEDAVEAIELARRSRPDLAIVDAKMPGGGGPRAVREILLHSPGTIVVALSAHADQQSVLQMLEAGAVDYIVKGTPANQLLSAIDRCRSRLRV
jgi:DNA-binding NarL/FixJ family response regulator